ncbi:MAG: twin-arginine translocase TatA/TatE family subunit [Alphaproteobacteria bacterium]
MSIGIWQILIVVVLLVLLFGRGKISGLMGDVAEGIKSFRKGMSEDPIADQSAKADPEAIDVSANKAEEPAKTEQ